MAACVGVMVFISVWMLGYAYSVPGYRHQPGDCADGFMSAHHGITREQCAGICNERSNCEGWIWIGDQAYCALKSPMCQTPVGVNSPKEFTAYYKISSKDISDSSSTYWVANEAGSTIHVTDPLATVHMMSASECALECAHTDYWYLYSYAADNACTLYNMGSTKTIITDNYQWWEIDNGI